MFLYTRVNKTPTHINVRHIVYFEPWNEGSDTRIYLADGETLVADEPIETVAKAIADITK